MCGRINLFDKDAILRLITAIGCPLAQGSVDKIADFNLGSRFVRATQTVPIIVGIASQGRNNHGRNNDDGASTFASQLKPALWWLLQEESSKGLVPSKLTSFNTRFDKLNVPHSAGYIAYRRRRCLLPVSGFGETQGSGKSARYTDFIAYKGAMLLAGLYNEYQHSQTDEILTSCSIITLPPHAKLASYHSKSSPMQFPLNKRWIKAWLSPEITDVSRFAPLLQPRIMHNLKAIAVNKPSETDSEIVVDEINKD